VLSKKSFKANILYLVGDWNITDEFAESLSPKAKMIYRYQAEKVFIVASSEDGVAVNLRRNDKLLDAEAGSHVNPDSSLNIKNDQLYRLIEDPAGSGEHTLEIIIDQPGLRVFTFTFG